jgi:hypothetical protein
MNTMRKYSLLPLGLLFAVLAAAAMAQTVPAPALLIAPTNTNQLSITVTNGVSYANYILYNQHVLGGSWTFITNPVPGVTNFVVNPGPYFQGFYMATGSTNWNNDGIPNWDLADPNIPGLGALTISIVSPAQGAIIH